MVFKAIIKKYVNAPTENLISGFKIKTLPYFFKSNETLKYINFNLQLDITAKYNEYASLS